MNSLLQILRPRQSFINNEVKSKALAATITEDNGENKLQNHRPSAFCEAERQQRVPTQPPPFTLAELKKAIPAHCFERSVVTSFRYLFVDLFFISLLFWSTQFFDHPALPTIVSLGLWIGYWLVQGFIMTGVWVISHECGHGAFSKYELLNDTVGWCGHSFLLVPYFSWKFTHARHHAKTGNLQFDEVFTPKKGPNEPISVPLAACLFVVQYSMGWFFYLLFGTAGRNYGRRASHFMPSSPQFKPKERNLVLLSDLGVILTLSVLFYLGYTYSFVWLLKVYIIPYLNCNFWLVFITQLQHTDQKLPHFDDEDWNWLRGALCTVDRNYGFLSVMFHHIGDTHVVHHLFSQLPHYHAQEATEAIKPILGKYYCYDDTPLFVACWHITRFCRSVNTEEEDKTNAYWYQ